MADRAVKVRVLLGVVVVLVSALAFGAGCGQQSSEQDRALEQQRQENEELRKQMEAQEREQEAAKQKAEEAERAAEQEKMQEQMDAIEKKLAEEESEPEPQESEPQESEPQESESEPDVVIQAAPPAQAPEGVVVVPSGYNVPASNTEESAVLSAAITYYQEVEVGDYYATHSLLCEDDKAYFPVDEWVSINSALESAAGEFVVTDAYPEYIGNGLPTYAVELTLYLTDGSSQFRKTYFVDEGNGYWAHWLTNEEIDLFNSAR